MVCFGYSDAIVPFGYLLAEFLKEQTIPVMVRLLLLVPFAATILPSFVRRTLARSVLTIVGLFLLTLLWLLGIVIYVVYPMPGNQIPNWVPAITSGPFLLAVIATITHSIRAISVARHALV